MLEKILRSLVQNTVLCNPSLAEGALPVGGSRIGGVPDLPEGFVWPWYEGSTWDDITANRPMAFLAQINLAEVHPWDRDRLLPAEGLLSFFYEMETMQWGFHPSHGGCAKVVYTPAHTDLFPTDPPDELDAMYRIPARRLTFAPQADLPAYEQFSARYTLDTEAPWETYTDACRDFGAPLPEFCGTRHKLLGFPDLIQGEIFAQCARVTGGTDCGNGPAMLTDAQRKQFAAEADNWRLLFQLSSFDDAAGSLMFGDMGSIFFCIRQDDLAACRFDRVWLILQCG